MKIAFYKNILGIARSTDGTYLYDNSVIVHFFPLGVSYFVHLRYDDLDVVDIKYQDKLKKLLGGT